MTVGYENEYTQLLVSPKLVYGATSQDEHDRSQWRHAVKYCDRSDLIILPGHQQFEFFLPSLLHIPSSPETRFTNELCHNINQNGLHDGWPCFVPRYLGHDQGVDAVAACIMKALQGVATHSSTKAIEVACAPDYARAISILQSKLRHPQIAFGDFALLMAVLFVCIDWIMHPEGSNAITSHVQGANSIILALPPQKTPSELRRSVILANWLGTFMIPVARGVASPYESRRWLECDTRLSGVSEDVARLSNLYTHLFIRLPRLIALVRKLREGNCDPNIKHQATQVAIVCAKLQDWETESRLLHQVRVAQTKDPDTAGITGTSFHFRHQCCWAEICYWQTRIITNWLCLKLLDLNVLPSDTFDHEKLLGENIRMAKNLIMSWEFGSTASGLSMSALRVGLIALWSVALSMGNVNKAFPISKLRQWIRQSYNLLHHQNYLFTEADLDEAADLLVGGPLKGILVESVQCTARLQCQGNTIK